MKALPKHLGGHANITHVDEGLLRYFIHAYNMDSFLDIGCGPGGMVKEAKDCGCRVLGIDGDFTLEYDDELRDDIVLHDFTMGQLHLNEQFDLGWSVEFLEHIEEQYLPNVFHVFKQCRFIMCTASTDGKNHFHQNAQPREYWIEKFKENGFAYREDDMDNIRSASTMKRNFINDTGMLYKNENA